MKLTEEQLAAIESRGKVIVSASAGSGKTFVMIEKLANAVLNGADLDEILAVTFTKKAAAQMKEKLRKVLVSRIESAGENRDRLKVQLSKISTADVSTIHSFCARLLRKYFYALGINSDFEVISSDDAVARELKKRAMDTVFEELYESDDRDFKTLLKCFMKKRSDGSLRRLVLQAHSEIRSCADYLNILENSRSLYSKDGFDRLCADYASSLKPKYAALIAAVNDFRATFPKTQKQAVYDKIFNEMLAGHKEKGEKTFSGADAFKLYDTYGFPVDLTLEMVREQGMELDEGSFKQLMEEQRQRARKAREALGDLGWAGVEFGKDVPETEFVGYENTAIQDARVVALVVENELAEELMPGVEGIVVLDKTPFYAEMGGQVADHGMIFADKAGFEVTDVQKNKGGKYMHYGRMTEGVLKVGDTVGAQIDKERRMAVMRAHTATHLLDKALREVLGDHVHQAGSLVEPDRLRFDFTHFEAMTPEQVAQVSRTVNDAILSGYAVDTQVLPIEEAKERGAIALFGEKYGDTVRVVDMGDGYSVEFCGGTHLSNTAMAGAFRIKSEFSVASGVRRIEATTGRETLAFYGEVQERINQAAAVLKAKPGELREKAEAVMGEIKNLHQMVEKFKAKEAAGETDRILFGAHEVGSLKVLTATVPEADGARLRQMGDMLREKDENVVAVLASVNDGKITFLCACGKQSVKRGIKAGDIIKQVCAIAGGSGGGKPDSAMGGGKDVLMLDNALAMVDNVVAMKLGV